MILKFLKKYPMTIMLAIIAANLISIAGSLNTEAKLNQQKLDCIKWRNYLKDDDFIFNKYRLVHSNKRDAVKIFCTDPYDSRHDHHY